MSELNPYQPPPPHDEIALTTLAGFISGGRAVDAGRGWDWVVGGIDLFKKQPGMWVLLFVAFAACTILANLVPLLGGVASALLYPVFGAGFMLACRDVDDDKPLTMGHLFAGFRRNTSDLVVVGLLSLIAIVVIVMPAMLMVGGAGFFAGMHGGVFNYAAMGLTIVLAGLLVMALSIPISMAMWFAPVLVIFHDLKPVDALKMSFFACLKNIVPFLLYAIIVAVMFVIAAIPFGLGFLVAVPVVIASIYAGYRDIFFAR